MTKATATKSIAVTYRNPETFAERAIRYSDRVNASGVTVEHIVTLFLPAGEDLYPMVWRFASVDDARSQWVKVTRDCKRAGYTAKVSEQRLGAAA
jgi:hypothetical protein